LSGCGGGSYAPPPINLSVSVNNETVVVPPNGMPVNVPVTIVAPTETATFTIAGLPAGVSESYKESESNPSGLLTLVAITSTVPGTYMPKITVGSSGQTASVVFTLVISAPSKPGNATITDAEHLELATTDHAKDYEVKCWRLSPLFHEGAQGAQGAQDII
jgi:hypothetical protein